LRTIQNIFYLFILFIFLFGERIVCGFQNQSFWPGSTKDPSTTCNSKDLPPLRLSKRDNSDFCCRREPLRKKGGEQKPHKYIFEIGWDGSSLWGVGLARRILDGFQL